MIPSNLQVMNNINRVWLVSLRLRKLSRRCLLLIERERSLHNLLGTCSFQSFIITGNGLALCPGDHQNPCSISYPHHSTGPYNSHLPFTPLSSNDHCTGMQHLHDQIINDPGSHHLDTESTYTVHIQQYSLQTNYKFDVLGSEIKGLIMHLHNRFQLLLIAQHPPSDCHTFLLMSALKFHSVGNSVFFNLIPVPQV